MKRDYKISIIRIIAMLSIVACHIFQAKEMNIAFWLNVGVQVFLFMSGFLYGKKKIEDTWIWLKKQFKKILMPYYIYAIIIILIYFIFARSSISVINIESIILLLQLIFPHPKGLGHLWFIPVILICYLLTPVLQKIVKTKEKIGIKETILLFGIIIFVELFFLQSAISVSICNIICYILGYFIAHLSLNYKREEMVLSISIIILAIISNIVKIYIVPDEYNILIRYILKVIVANSHILLGSAIFIILYNSFKFIEKHLSLLAIKTIDLVDKYCFYIYITHHVFILGPLSIINLTSSITLNIIIIICYTILSSYILEELTNLAKKGLTKT